VCEAWACDADGEVRDYVVCFGVINSIDFGRGSFHFPFRCAGMASHARLHPASQQMRWKETKRCRCCDNRRKTARGGTMCLGGLSMMAVVFPTALSINNMRRHRPIGCSLRCCTSQAYRGDDILEPNAPHAFRVLKVSAEPRSYCI